MIVGKIPSRKQLTIWLAKALCHVPDNLCDIPTGQMPPQWVKDAKTECERIGIRFVYPESRKSRKARN